MAGLFHENSEFMILDISKLKLQLAYTRSPKIDRYRIFSWALGEVGTAIAGPPPFAGSDVPLKIALDIGQPFGTLGSRLNQTQYATMVAMTIDDI